MGTKTNKLNVISIADYAKLLGFKGLSPTTLEKVQEWAEENCDSSVWDYPLDELDYVLKEVNENVCFVRNEQGETRVCELLQK